jgi:DNA transformation protein
MAELTSMRNIGREMEKKLKSVGICSAEELKRAGSKEAFSRLKKQHPNVCLVHLHTLQGAIDDVEYNRLSEESRRDLKAFCDRLK